MGYFLFEYEFWWRFCQDLYVFFTRNCFRNAKFGGYWRRGLKFFDETPKRHILGWVHAFWAINRANPFTAFCSRRVHEKKDTTKSRREVIFHLRGEFPAQPNLTKIDVSVGVADVINHTKFGNDRSKEYKVTEGRILPWSIGLACRL